jgi:hypothetical protein
VAEIHARPGQQLYPHAPVALAGLLVDRRDAVRLWVQRMLGELARDDERIALLRHTVQVLLEANGSYTEAAARMHVHKNTVLYRLRKAEELLGRPVTDDRLRGHDQDTRTRHRHGRGAPEGANAGYWLAVTTAGLRCRRLTLRWVHGAGTDPPQAAEVQRRRGRTRNWAGGVTAQQSDYPPDTGRKSDDGRTPRCKDVPRSARRG